MPLRVVGRLVVLVAFAVVMVGFRSVASSAQDATPAADPEANAALLRGFYDALNQRDLAALDAIVAADVVDQTAAAGQAPGLVGVKQSLAALLAGFPDGVVAVEDLIVDGDLVAARTIARGTQTGEFNGIPPTGKAVTFQTIDIWRVADGTLVEVWHIEDILGLLQQLGVVPGTPPAPPATAATPGTAASPAPTAGDTAVNEALAQRFHAEIFDQGNLAVADELLAPNFVWHVQVAPGAEGVKEFAQGIRAAFPDLRIASDVVLAAGDKVVIHWTLSGTHQGEFFGVPASGRPVSAPGTDIYRIENGQIAEIWTVGDDFGILTQIGAIPSAGAATPIP